MENIISLRIKNSYVSEKEFSIILKRWGIKYSIQLTFIECLLSACCWVRLINRSWTRLMFREMKYWLLLFVPSVILAFNLYWTDTIPSDSNIQQCTCALHYVLQCHYSCSGFLFICHVHMPQPSFCHSQLYFLLLFNTYPL